MGTLRADTLSATTTNGDLNLSGNGTGNVNLATGTELNGTALTSTFLSSSGSGSGLTDLNASNLASGTVPDARFPATLPAASGVNLTALNATNLGSGSVPDARLPANLQSFPAPGSDGNVLTAASGSWTSAAAAGGGAWSVKSSGTFSSTTALEITSLTKTTTVYYNARCATQNGVAIRTSSNNGTSYDSVAGNYQQVGYSAASGVTTFAFPVSGVFLTAIFLNQTVQAAGTDISGWFTIFSPADTTTTQIIGQMYGDSASGDPQYGSTVHAMRDSAAAVNAIKFDFNGAVGASFSSGSYCVIELN